MKLIPILFGFVAVVYCAVQRDKFKLPEEKLARIHKISHSCALEHNVDPGLTPDIAEGTLPRTEPNNKFLHCFAVKADLVDDIGHIKIDKLAALLGDHPRVEEFRETLAKCNDVTKEDPVATVVQMNECYATTSPVLLVF